MTAPPLPDTPTVRVRLIGIDGVGNFFGSRIYLSYAGSAPTGANCTTLAGDIEAAWATHLAPLLNENCALTEVDVLDIATDSGLSGQWTGSAAGSRAGSELPIQCALGIEYGIGRRYRGGKPRGYWPFGVAADQSDPSHWSSTFITAANSAFEAFMAEVVALSVGAMGTLTHVNLSYYKGFTNITNSSGRERAVPTYRASAIHDDIVGYSAKSVISSQRRRRTSTTP